MMKRVNVSPKFKLLLFALFLSVAPVVSNAQTHFDETDPDGGQVEDSPVDGGVAFLLIAGLGLGAMKIYGIKKHADLKKSN